MRALVIMAVGFSWSAYAQPMLLTCGGGGTAVKPQTADVTGDVSATIWSQRDRDFTDQVDVELNGSEGRIRMPRTMLPPLRGGKAGWFKLKNVKITERTITASAAVNFINAPKVHIDRVTGTISISGKTGDYSGRCEAIDPATAQKKF